jgi:hypothetical protein
MIEPRRDLIVACVRTGDRYPMDYVARLRNMVERFMPVPYQMICLTDQPERCSGVTFIDVSDCKLPGWWAKMVLFAPEWRHGRRVVYIDLDVVVVGDLGPLAAVPSEVAILASPVREAGNLLYPCKFNSSVMVLRETLTGFIWLDFELDRETIMMLAGNYGDQRAIEMIYPGADILQTMLPKGFIVNYRNLTMIKPKGAAIVTFGGKHKPANCEIPWVQKLWA